MRLSYSSSILCLLLAACTGGGDDGAAPDARDAPDAEPGLTCGAGTIAQDGVCVPDGTVICDQGTVFEPTSGTCVLDPSACAAGTVLIGGVCVPEDGALTADVEEAEPADVAGTVSAPALGDDVTIHGCITPVGDDADLDIWRIEASGPMVLDITADGVGGLAAAFVVTPSGIPELDLFRRFGLNLTGDTAHRQVYLPLAGVYLLSMQDSRSLLGGGIAVGGAGTCYYTTIAQVALPASTFVTGTATGSDDGNVKLFIASLGEIGYAELHDATSLLEGAYVLRKNGAFVAAASEGAARALGGLVPSDMVQVIVDNELDLALTPQAYTVAFGSIDPPPLPRDGSTSTVTRHNGELGLPALEHNFASFDVAAGAVVRLAITASAPVEMAVVRAPFAADGTPATFVALGSGTGVDAWTRFLTGGHYYLTTYDPSGSAGSTYTLTSTLTEVAPTAITYGSPISGNGFHSLDLIGQDWIELGVTANGYTGSARVTLYDLAADGVLTPIQTSTQPKTGASPRGRITRGDARDLLLHVDDTGGSAASYALVVRDRPHVDLGTVAAGAPVVRTNMDPTAAGATTRYLIFAPPGHQVTISVAPTSSTTDIRIIAYGLDESTAATFDTGGVGSMEVLDANVPAAGWVAFGVTNTGAVDSTNLSVTAVASP